MTDFWLPTGIPGYAVSQYGRVRNTRTGRILRPFMRGFDRSYRAVQMYWGGRRYVKSVHQVVATAWCIPPNSKATEVNHKDKDRTNNRASNLEWVTRSQNELHKRRHDEQRDN